MKTIGLIGGMSWESTQHYYQLMNQYVHARLGRHNSVEAIIYSVNFERILALVHQDNWELVGQEMARLAQKLENAGADFLMLTSNAVHKVFPQVEAAVSIPLLHIVDPTAEAILKAGIKKIGLLGTKVTMEEPFYKHRLLHKHGIEVVVPESADQNTLHHIVFEELALGKIHDSSKRNLAAMIASLWSRGAGGIILGCTELSLLISPEETEVPLFDTTALHAKAAIELACRVPPSI